MYAGSLELEALKKSTTNALQRSTRRIGWNPGEAPSSRQARRIAAGSANIHGRNPNARIGRKYHQAATRRCSVVRKRSKCSWMKKKRANSGLAAETAMNHGAAMAKKSGRPNSHSRRLRIDRSRRSTQ